MSKSQRLQHITSIRQILETNGFVVKGGKYLKENVLIEIANINIKVWRGKTKVWSKPMVSLTPAQIYEQVGEIVNANDANDIKYKYGGASKVTIESEDEIKGFFGKYRCFSNFDTTPFVIDGITYKSGEHAFQYYKTLDNEWRQRILAAETPAIAKKLGRKCPMRNDWNEVKVEVMRDILWHKFSQNEQLKEVLTSTKTKYLEETNTWNDRFWGVCKGVGQNELGKALMDTRRKLLEVDAI